MQRHYGLDWLRVGAFAILIVYHVGMVFVPWNYHVKMQVADWVAVPMLVSNPWRLALLFVVSGYASRALLRRHAGPLSFAKGRSIRLLVPLIFGIAVIVPPQPWVELVTKHGYAAGLGHFWLHDYFRFGRIGGLWLPTWNHLWFVGYLWLYTMLLSGGIAVAGGHRAAIQRGYDRVFAGGAAILLPVAWMLLVDLFVYPGRAETQALIGDGVAHAIYLPAFLFGFGLARAPAVLRVFARSWPLTLALAAGAFAIGAGVEIGFPGRAFPPGYGEAFAAARAVQGWTMIAALIGIAERFWNRDHRWRPVLTEAVFPFYLIHQTIIVVVAWALLRYALPMPVNFAVMIAATVAGCWIFYRVGRSVTPLRPLIGLRAAVARPPRTALLTVTD